MAGDAAQSRSSMNAADGVRPMRVGWSRGHACSEVAELLGAGESFQISGDLRSSVIEGRADIVVMRRTTKFDLVPSLVPRAVDVGSVGSVTAAVGTGPHGDLVVQIACMIGQRLRIPVEAVSVVRPSEDRGQAETRLETLANAWPNVEARIVEGDAATAVVDGMGPSALLVVGAPGGSWFQRQIHGPGHRLMVRAPAGALVVRSVARKCFQEMGDPHGAFVGVHTPTTEVARIAPHPVVSVVDDGRLVGVVRASEVVQHKHGVTVDDLMEPGISLQVDEPVDAADELADFFEGGPIPVTDVDGRLVGIVRGA